MSDVNHLYSLLSDDPASVHPTASSPSPNTLPNLSEAERRSAITKAKAKGEFLYSQLQLPISQLTIPQSQFQDVTELDAPYALVPGNEVHLDATSYYKGVVCFIPSISTKISYDFHPDREGSAVNQVVWHDCLIPSISGRSIVGVNFKQVINVHEGLIVASDNESPDASVRDDGIKGEEYILPALKKWSDVAFLQWLLCIASNTGQSHVEAEATATFNSTQINSDIDVDVDGREENSFASVDSDDSGIYIPEDAQSYANTSNSMSTNLRYVLRHNVSNISSLAVVRAACASVDGNTSSESFRAWPGVTLAADSQYGKALLGTPNGVGVAYMLIQHRKILGHKVVEKIQCWDIEGTCGSMPMMLFYVVDA